MNSAATTVVSSDFDWSPAPEPFRLEHDEVHVWRACLDQSSPQVEVLEDLLNEDERSRADRFYFSRDRRRFIVARGILRSLVGRYLGSTPERISLSYGVHRKPALRFESGPDAIRFNLSHSHGIALYALTRGREVGVDLELVRGDLKSDQIAEQFFSPNEILALRALPPTLRQYAFFLCWTRKEAYIKARGEGLTMPLDQFDVSLIPGEPAALLSTRPDSDEALKWSLRNLTPASGYAAALAVEGRDWSLSRWQWPRS